MKVMYYDNILISDLMSDDHLEHHGVLGQKWGIRRYQSYSTVPRGSGKGGKETGLARKKSRLQAKKASNSAKLAKYKAKQDSPEAKARRANIEKYSGKANKVNSSVITRRADYKLARGKDVGTLGDINLRKRAYYESRASKFLAEEAKLNAKVAKLEARDLRLDKKLSKVNTKLKMASLTEDLKGPAVVSRLGGPTKVNYTDGTKGYSAATHVKTISGLPISGSNYGFGDNKKAAQLDADVEAYLHITKNNKSGRTRNKSAQVKLEKSLRKQIGNDEAFDRIMNARSRKDRHLEMYNAGVWSNDRRR